MKKALSILLSICLLAGCLSGFSFGAGALYYSQGQKISRAIADEGIILLKNENAALPVAHGAAVAIFGEAQKKGPQDEFWNTKGYIPYGYGSETQVGEFEDQPIDPLDALEEAEQNGEIAIYHKISDRYVSSLANGEQYTPTDAEVAAAAAEADTAIFFISRWGGEIFDVARSDWYLKESEKTLLKQLSDCFKKVVVVLNTSSVIDTSWAKDEMDGIHVDAVLFVGYTGLQGGIGIADVLLGRVNPSGKTTDTWAKDIADYPSTASWDEKSFQAYTEDIFVGYRYFETFDPNYEKVNYEFGYGLSYTDFTVETKNFIERDGTVSVDAVVTNTGAVAGKEVVQMYVGAPQGDLGKAAKSLCDYAKTKKLAPGESQTLTLNADMADLASFDDLGKTGNKACYVLEKGDYRFWVGNSIRSAAEVGVATVDKLLVTKKLTSLCPTNLEKRLLANGSYETLPKREEAQNYVHMEEAKPNVTEPPVLVGRRLSEVVFGTMTMDEYLAQWSDRELATFFVSYDQNQVGCSDALCAKFGLNRFSQGDGGQGLCFMGTVYPCVTILASTWSDDLAEAFGLLLGAELYKNNVGMWLGPAVNIHRNPLCGRNLEYYSEDPYLTGRFAATIIENVQRNGVPVCIKHMVCNEKEADKIWCDSRVSERALREIYLKPFEMGIKDAHAEGIMTSYNIVNGVPTSENADMLRGIVRGEWGYQGFITSDWGNLKNQVKEINASNNVHTPYDHCDINLIYDAIDSGEITRATLEEGAKQILWTLMRTSRYYRANACVLPHQYGEDGLCTVCHSPDPAIRRNLSKNLAKLVPDADINIKLPVHYGYRDATDFIGRNTESFLSVFMRILKYIVNAWNQIVGKVPIK